jgi:hypothetical protein
MLHHHCAGGITHSTNINLCSYTINLLLPHAYVGAVLEDSHTAPPFQCLYHITPYQPHTSACMQLLQLRNI